MTDPECPRCFSKMELEKGIIVDVVRCTDERCPAEGAIGPFRKFLRWWYQ